MTSGNYGRLRHLYKYKTMHDHVERAYLKIREHLFGLDPSVFEKPILYYSEVKKLQYSPKQALQRALNKNEHKQAWFARPRHTVEEIFQFYTEVDIYPFRQTYIKRHATFRWYLELVNHTPRPRVLEYGCGSAILTEWLCDRFTHAEYTIADIPSVTLDFVRWKKARFNYPYTILAIGPGKSGIPLRESYDLIICEDVLEHTPNPDEIAQAFVDRLRPRGVLVVNFLNAPGGENLESAAALREETKKILERNLFAIKTIDQPDGNDGLYVKE